MKKVAAFVIMASLAGLVGCHGENKSGTGGAKPTGSTGGAKPTGSGAGGGEGAVGKTGTFTIVQEKPTGTVDITQGDQVPVQLGLKREHNYGGNVAVEANVAVGPAGVKKEDVPKSLKLDLEPKSFPGDKPDQKLILSIGAAGDAVVGDYAIQVIGKPAKEGDKATSKPLEIKVHVKKK